MCRGVYIKHPEIDPAAVKPLFLPLATEIWVQDMLTDVQT